jgi:RecA-family ATPase
MRKRLRKVWLEAADEVRARFFMCQRQFNLTDEADVERLHGLIVEVAPNVVIIDPLRNAHTWDENSSQEMAQLTGILDVLIARHHCALIAAHHDRKRPPMTKRDSGTDRIRGSTGLAG